MTLQLHPTEQVQVKMVQEKVGLESGSEKYFADFYLTEDPSFFSNSGDGNVVKMKIVFKRCLSIEALDTFLPSLLLILLSYVTSFFKLPKFFNAITVNLSVMLTVTTLLISVLKNLPPTSYIKWIEYWLIFALMVPFSQAVLLTAIQWDQERKNETKDEDGDNSCWLNIGDARVGFFKQPISLTTTTLESLEETGTMISAENMSYIGNYVLPIAPPTHSELMQKTFQGNGRFHSL